MIVKMLLVLRILDAWAKPTLGPTQGEFLAVVVMFGAFCRLTNWGLVSKVDSTFSKNPNNREICHPYVASLIE